MSPPARQLSAQADPPSGLTSSPDVRNQHAPGQSPAAAAADVIGASAHGDANKAANQEDKQSQLSLDIRTPPSHAAGFSIVDNTVRPDPSHDDSSTHTYAMQPGTAPQNEGAAQQSACMPSDNSESNAHVEGHAPQLAIEALGSDLSEEDEESGPEQETDSAMQDEEDRIGDLGLPPGHHGLGSESDFPHASRNVLDVLGAAELELPEEGWMWSAVQNPSNLKLAMLCCRLTCIRLSAICAAHPGHASLAVSNLRIAQRIAHLQK